MVIQKKIFNIFLNTPSKDDKKHTLDGAFFVKETPPEGFPHRNRNFGGCAHYSLKAVIEGKDNIKKPVENYSSDWRSRKTFLMTPWGIIKVLKKYNLEYSILRGTKFSKEEKLQLLKENLKKGPIILLVANGQTKKKRFSRGKALTHWHYITLWGYDEKSKIFYVYDSNTSRKTENKIMKGTLKVPYKYILKERGIGASKIIYNNYAIAVKY